MITYQVVIEKQAVKQLSKITPPYYGNIVSAIQGLAINPKPISSIKLKGRDGFRIRVADYRIIYTINDAILTVFVIIIKHRTDVYE
jgi:mRNA interferase RelE/StbE